MEFNIRDVNRSVSVKEIAKDNYYFKMVPAKNNNEENKSVG